MSALRIDELQLAALCRRHHIRRLSFFGSVLREDFGPHSDVDVLVEFEPGQVPGFFGLHDIQQELAVVLNHPRIDLRTAEDLHRSIRSHVLAEAEVQYVQG